MKRFLSLAVVLAVFLTPVLVFAVTADSLVGSWGYVMIKHNNDNTWNSRAGSLTFKSDGTGLDSYANNANGTQGSGTENFSYTATVNGDGSLTVVYTYTNRTVIHRYVMSDDGKNLIIDGMDDLSSQRWRTMGKMNTSGYANTDLNGDFYVMGYEYAKSGEYVSKSGVMSFDGNGAFSFSGKANTNGTVSDITGESGTYSMGSNGFFSLGSNAGGLCGEKKAALVTSGSAEKMTKYVALKKGDKTYSNADLAGTWALSLFGDNLNTTFQSAIGTATCESNGVCKMSFREQDTGVVSYGTMSLVFSISADGSFGSSLGTGYPSYAGAIGNDGNMLVLNPSFGPDPNGSAINNTRTLVVGLKCSACGDLTTPIVPMMTLKKNASGDMGADLSLYDPASKSMTTIVSGLSNATFPRMNATQTKVLFTDFDKNNTDEGTINVFDIASKTTTQVTAVKTTEDSADFTSDGKILFIDKSDGVIKKMNIDGTGITTVATPESSYKFSALWLAPNRQYVAAIENRQEGSDYNTGNKEKGVLVSLTDGSFMWKSEEYLGEWNLLSWRADSLAFFYGFHTFNVTSGVYKSATPQHLIVEYSSGQFNMTDLSNTALSKKGQNIAFYTESGKLLSLNTRSLYDSKGALVKSVSSSVPEFMKSMYGFDGFGSIYLADLDGSNFRRFSESGSSTAQTQTYTVTVTKSGTGSGSITADKGTLACGTTTCVGAFDKGTRVVLTATADSGSAFDGWGSGCKGTGKCVVAIKGNTTLTASFVEATPVILIPQTTLNFGKVKVKASKVIPLKIVNNGKTDLTVDDVQISGTDADMFSTNFTAAKTLKPKKSLTVSVKFKPTSQGLKNATLTVSSDDPDTPSKEITMSGTGK